MLNCKFDLSFDFLLKYKYEENIPHDWLSKNDQQVSLLLVEMQE